MNTAQAHAAMRARQRYGVDLTADDCSRIASLIEAGDPAARRLPRGWAARDWYAVWMGGKRWLAVVYDHRDKIVVTCLPKRAINPWRNKLNRLAERLEGVA